ncbi:hypothetical protein RRG08_056437 [Elysia crispata]|uniref:Uncharacterized protein n=1 Tax=Elysia crispata TaxID=231223 RepID=A0AAE1CW59_9GAST|nr:hypothetical protein RRG08_056437 [Elysia crispata]
MFVGLYCKMTCGVHGDVYVALISLSCTEFQSTFSYFMAEQLKGTLHTQPNSKNGLPVRFADEKSAAGLAFVNFNLKIPLGWMERLALNKPQHFDYGR